MSHQTLNVLAGASASPKPLNQDAFALARHAVSGYSLLAVADGIGSHLRAEAGAACVIETVVSAFHSAADPAAIDLRKLFAAAAESVKALADSEGIEEAHRESVFGTTLLCAIETPAEIRIAYVGNGGLLLVQPGLLGSQPWTAWGTTNLLRPHSVMRNGKEVLTRLLSAGGPGPVAEPTVLTLARDSRREELLLLCSDGLWSADHITLGTDPDSRVWQATNAPLARVLSALGEWAVPQRGTVEDLTASLEACVAGLCREDLVDDDCTVAVLLSEPV